MSKQAKPVKKRKRTRVDWKARFKDCCRVLEIEIADLFSARSELTRYRLICDWACQRIEELEMVDLSLEKSLTEEQRYIGNLAERLHTMQSEKRILLDTLFEVQAENIMQGEDILRQRDELIKLRGVSGERVSCQR